MKRRLVRFPALLGLSAALAFGQRPEFEVASVKLNRTDGRSDGSGPRRSANSVVMHNVQPYSVLYYAFNLHGNYQMAGYVPFPDESNWYDIEALAASSTTDAQIRLMFLSLLEDRFKLKFHREIKELPVFELTVRNRPRLTPAREGPMTVTIEDRSVSQREGACGTSLWKGGNHLLCHAVGIDKFVAELSRLLQSPVVDRTGVTGSYDVNLLYLPESRQFETNAPAIPSLQDAVQDLGLKLEKGRAPIEVIVIDHLEKPSDN